MKEIKNFEQFLSCTSGQNEVSLAVVDGTDEIEQIGGALTGYGFAESQTDTSFFENIAAEKSTFFVVNEKLSKKVYDILVQFPTGQIETFNEDEMRPEVIKPNRGKFGVLLIFTKSALEQSENDGFLIMDKVGLTFRK